VIAAGAWSGEVARLAGVEMPIQPRKGTLIVTAPLPDDLLNCKVILSAGYMDSVKDGGAGGVSVAANIQQVRNGNLLLGSTRQFAGFDLRVEPEIARQVASRCLRFLPALGAVSAIRMWSGLRPYTPDLLPVIGPLSAAPGLYFAAGHEGIGITEGPITGLLISQLLTGEKTELALDRLSPDRFSTTI
jgi:D-hydroxyproline dehydrogenase subunit beta